MMIQEARIRGLVENLAQCGHNYPPDAFHASSTKAVITNGASFTCAVFLPESTRIHSFADSNKISVTRKIKPPVTHASRRSLKTMRGFVIVRAWARNPIRGFGSNTLCHDAVNVTATSQASGASVTHA